MKFLKFVAGLYNELYELFTYSEKVIEGQESDPEYERELAGRLIRKASDEAMKRELGL